MTSAKTLPFEGDHSFWQGIADADFAVPTGHTPASLAPVLLSTLGLIDPTIREGPCYDILETWVHRRVFDVNQLHAVGDQMVRNLRLGLGRQEDDSVFLRTFSILILNEIINLRVFLRSLCLQIRLSEAGLASSGVVLPLLEGAIRAMDREFYALPGLS